jgi:hypothetical protein
MKIVINKEELEYHVIDIINDMGNNQILLDHFLGGQLKLKQMQFVMGKMFILLVLCSTLSLLEFILEIPMLYYLHITRRFCDDSN